MRFGVAFSICLPHDYRVVKVRTFDSELQNGGFQKLLVIDSRCEDCHKMKMEFRRLSAKDRITTEIELSEAYMV